MENILLSYLSLDVGKGVVLSPTHWATPTGTMHSELLSCFQKTCAAIRDVLVGGVERGGEGEEEESEDEYDWGSEEEEEEEKRQEGKVGLFSYLTLPSPPCECNLFSLFLSLLLLRSPCWQLEGCVWSTECCWRFL